MGRYLDEHMDVTAWQRAVDENGTDHKADILKLATGCKAQCPLTPITVIGTNGSIRDHWGKDDCGAPPLSKLLCRRGGWRRRQNCLKPLISDVVCINAHSLLHLCRFKQ
jgi:hypothetical protein